MSTIKHIKRALLLFFLTFCFSPLAKEYQHGISLVKLIATPEKYDNELVYVQGFLRLEFEGDSLWLHKEDWENGLIYNRVKISLPNTIQFNKLRRKCVENRYVIIEGRFKKPNPRIEELSSGMIFDITRIDSDYCEEER